jgi:mono/diheme cytochrome c family protein
MVLRYSCSRQISSLLVLWTSLMLCISAAQGQDTSFGQRLFHDKADCQFCHGVNGDGHGDPRSPGKASDLHKTLLTREQLVEVIACGRPGSEMPHFDKYAYEDKSCYGISAEEVGKNKPPDPHSTTLTKREIEAVADYVLAKFAGK